ncbi:MAG: sigma-70 family RNA polymerase sigma factor [Gemmataceae bacterium]
MANRAAGVLRRALLEESHALTDRELLRRYAANRDEAAFAALVARHTGLVFGVCHRMLHSVQDAEDAAQATFLVLAKKAASGRWGTSVANWLYTTARKTAANARVAAARRAKRDAKAAVRTPAGPLDTMTGRELLATLDEELDRLPAVFREPLVLCHLEGLSRDEVAVRLGVPVGTVKSRLERGRKRLAAALTKRDVVLGAGLLALAVSSPAGASPLRIVEAVLDATAGHASPAVVALAEGVAVNGLLSKSPWVAAALAGVVTLGIGVGVVRSPAGQPPEKATPAKPAPATDPKAGPAKPQAEVTGRVFGPDGKPFAGAKLVLFGRGKAVELGMSDAAGRFAVVSPAGDNERVLAAKADGLGFDFVTVSPSAGAVELRLVKDQAIRGCIVDTQGRPVAGATLALKSLSAFAGDSADPFLGEWKTRHFMSGLPGGVKNWWGGGAAVPVATTDADGRFAIAGLGAERVALFAVRGTGIAEAELLVITRDGFDPQPHNRAATDNVPAGMDQFAVRWLLYGPDLTYVAEAEKPVRGVVTDIDTGEPQAGVTVSLTRNGPALVAVPQSATTDAAGRYEIRGARKAKDYMIEVPSDPATGHLPAQVHGGDTPGYGPVVIDVRVKKGIIITGRVIDGGTGRGVPGFVSAEPLHDNPHVKAYPPASSAASFPRGETAVDGSFRVVALPGPVVLAAGPDTSRLPGGAAERLKYKPAAADPKYPQYFTSQFGLLSYLVPGGGFGVVQGNACRVLDVAAGATAATQDIVLERVAALDVTARDAAGNPVAGTWATGLSAEDWNHPMRMEAAMWPVYNLQPGKPRRVVVYEPTKRLFGSRILHGDEATPAVIKLGPGGAVAGRVVDEDRKPLAGIAVKLIFRVDNREAAEMHFHVQRSKPAETAADGSFRIDELVPFVEFTLGFGTQRKGYEPMTKAAEAFAAPGATLDAGTIMVKPKS